MKHVWLSFLLCLQNPWKHWNVCQTFHSTSYLPCFCILFIRKCNKDIHCKYKMEYYNWNASLLLKSLDLDVLLEMIIERSDASEVDVFSSLNPAIMFMIFWGCLMVKQILLSPQVKRSMIISNKHRISELPYVLPNNWKLRILRN